MLISFNWTYQWISWNWTLNDIDISNFQNSSRLKSIFAYCMLPTCTFLQTLQHLSRFIKDLSRVLKTHSKIICSNCTNLFLCIQQSCAMLSNLANQSTSLFSCGGQASLASQAAKKKGHRQWKCRCRMNCINLWRFVSAFVNLMRLQARSFQRSLVFQLLPDLVFEKVFNFLLIHGRSHLQITYR